MENIHIHENKPPVSAGTSSMFIDLILWHPNDKDATRLIQFLEDTDLGERSQTVEWLNKITVRLSMWKHKYWHVLTDDEWALASQDISRFVQLVNDTYKPRHIEYDTRSFVVGLQKKVKRQRRPITQMIEGRPGHDNPVWWYIIP